MCKASLHIDEKGECSLLGAKTAGFPLPELHVINRRKVDELNQLPNNDCC
jgi:hypothetical protein